MLGKFVKNEFLLKQFTRGGNPQEVVQNLEKERFWSRASRFNKDYPMAKFYFAGVGAFSFLLSFWAKWDQSSAEKQIEFRKNQLQKPIQDLSEGAVTNYPWSQRNINDWLFRPVRITGRPLHRLAMLIPTFQYGMAGFEYVVPVVTKETPEFTEQEGILVNKGFIPAEFAHVANRFKLENSLPQTFVGYVSQMEEYQDHGFLEGNCPAPVRNKWSHANLSDMAKTTEFKNQDLVKVAVIEAVNPESVLDERDMDLRELSCDYREDYPWMRTRSGALQLRQMPWDYQRKAATYADFGIIFSAVSALLFFVK